MKTNKSNLRLPTLQEFLNLVADAQSFNFQNYWYLTSDQPKNKTFVEVFNPIENSSMTEHISYEYNVRLVYDDGKSIQWEKNDEVSLVKKGKTKFTFEQAQEHIQNVTFDSWYSDFEKAIKSSTSEILYSGFCTNESVKETHETRLELLENEIKRLKTIITYLEDRLENK